MVIDILKSVVGPAAVVLAALLGWWGTIAARRFAVMQEKRSKALMTIHGRLWRALYGNIRKHKKDKDKNFAAYWNDDIVGYYEENCVYASSRLEELLKDLLVRVDGDSE